MMYKMTKGFTLIELLVVVLIIGILAAVAVPQYQRAVLKSRMAHGLVFARAIHAEQERYFLANGQYASSTAQLDVQMQCPPKMNCVITNQKVDVDILGNDTLCIVYYHDHSTAWKPSAGKFYCWADLRNVRAGDICKSYGPISRDYSSLNPPTIHVDLN